MHRAFFHILKGLIGIFNNKNFSIKKKIIIYFDYFKLIIIVIQSRVSPRLTNLAITKKFYMSSFNLKIYYSNIYTLFFQFNEIFCNSEYPILLNLKSYIDLGANIGISILWYHLFNPAMIIYAFEPDEINFRLLEKNIKENYIKNCLLIKKAVSDTAGKVNFYRILDNIQNLDSGLKLNQKLPHEVFQVQTEKLSTLISKIKTASLIKMDIEGGEYLVFRDLKKENLLPKIERIIFESHTFNPTEEKELTDALIYMGSLGSVQSHKTSRYTSTHYWKNNRLA